MKADTAPAISADDILRHWERVSPMLHDAIGRKRLQNGQHSFRAHTFWLLALYAARKQQTSAAEIAETMPTTYNSANNALRFLQANGLMHKIGPSTERTGHRPRILWAPTPKLREILGLKPHPTTTP